MAKQTPIFIPGTNKVYPSVAAAAKDLRINASGISKVLSGKRPHAGGYRFGYLSDRVIYVPETGQTFSDTVQASKKLGVKNKKIKSVLQSGVDRTVGKGYHVVYESSATLSRPSEQPPQETQKRKPRKTKKERRLKKKERIKWKKELEKLKKGKPDSVDFRKTPLHELQSYLKILNDQLQKYYDEHLMGYSRAAQAVLAYTQYLGEYEDKYTGLVFFDVSDDAMEELAENMTDEKIIGWIDSIKETIKGYNGLFWDIKKQKDERDFYALEFLVDYPGMIDEYVDLFPDLWAIFEEARHKQGDAYRAGGAWEEIQEAVRGGVSREALAEAIQKLHDYYYNDSGKLSDILNDLNSKYTKYNPSPLSDDDDLPF